MTIGNRIKERRTEVGMTLKQLGDKIGVSEATMQRYESGKINNIPQDKFAKLADALDTSSSWLRGDLEESPSPKHTKTFELTISEQIIVDCYRKATDQERSAIRTLLLTMDTAKNREHELCERLDFAEEFIGDMGETSSYEALAIERFKRDKEESE